MRASGFMYYVCNFDNCTVILNLVQRKYSIVWFTDATVGNSHRILMHYNIIIIMQKAGANARSFNFPVCIFPIYFICSGCNLHKFSSTHSTAIVAVFHSSVQYYINICIVNAWQHPYCRCLCL